MEKKCKATTGVVQVKSKMYSKYINILDNKQKTNHYIGHPPPNSGHPAITIKHCGMVIGGWQNLSKT